MAIIVEGFDNSGKSTLAASFGLEIVHPGPRPKTSVEEDRCLIAQIRKASQRVVMDRVTSVSTPCYSGMFDTRYRRHLDILLNTPHCVLIYCRPPMEVIRDFSRHEIKSYDDEGKIKWLMEHAEAIVGRYDLYMAQFPHMKYDYTNPDFMVPTQAYNALLTMYGWNTWNSLTTQL